jgi:AbrB family looped-hinge helix DNA binding protein
MDAAARVTSKGQVTVPKAGRDALGIKEGDEVVFRVEDKRAVLARTPDFLDLAGSVTVPAAKRNVAWDEVIRRTRSADGLGIDDACSRAQTLLRVSAGGAKRGFHRVGDDRVSLLPRPQPMEGVARSATEVPGK